MESFAANRPDAQSQYTYTLHGDQTKCPHYLTFEFVFILEITGVPREMSISVFY